MAVLLLLVMLAAGVAGVRDLSGSMFTFPQQNNRAHVKVTLSSREFSAVTVCHRSFTDLKRDHGLFSLATPSSSNDFLIFWDQATGELKPHIKNQKVEYRGLDYKPNMWHSICTTWDSQTGLVQMWFDGQPTIKKFISSGSSIRGTAKIVLGQEQDSHGGGFDANQSFVGMMTDVHMWDHVLSECEIQKYTDDRGYTPGNVINWRALDYQIVDKVIVERRFNMCVSE